MRPTLSPLSDLLAAAQAAEPARSFSALSETPALLLDADWRQQGLSATQADAVADWLRQQACPTIAIVAADADPHLAAACDVQLRRVDEAAALCANIARSPLAATVLVQLLRLTENLTLADGLVAESLAYSVLQAGPEFRRWHAGHVATLVLAADTGPAVLLQRNGATLQVQLNRPSRHNAMSVELRDALIEALQLVLADDSIASVQLSGRGKCFSTGGAVGELRLQNLPMKIR